MTEQELASNIKRTWTCFYRWTGLLSGTPYSAWRSPDGKFEIGIHDLDNEIIAIRDVESGKWILNPRDVAILIMKVQPR